MFFGRHDEVVRFVFVVDDVLEIDAGGGVELAEELLVEDEGHARDLLDARLGLRLAVDEVGRDGDGQTPAKLFAFESLEGVALAVGADQHVELVLRHGVLGWTDLGLPADLCSASTAQSVSPVIAP